MKRLIFPAIIMAFQTLSAQEIRGIFFSDKTTGSPVPNISVNSDDGKVHAVSDQNGLAATGSYSMAGHIFHVTGGGRTSFTLPADSVSIRGDYGYYSMDAGTTDIASIVLTRNGTRTQTFQPVSDLDLRLRPLVNSQEAMRSVPGLFIGQHAGGGKAEQLFLRGFDADHGTDVAVSADGVPVNMPTHAHGQGYADLHFVIPEMVERLAYDKGPYFADKGDFDTAGYVELKTKDYLDSNFLKLEAGQFDTYRGVFGADLLGRRQREDGQHLLLASEVYYTDNYFDNPQDFNRLNFMAKYYGKVSGNSFLRVAATAFSSKWNASGQIPDRAVDSGMIGWFGALDPDEGGRTSRYNFNTDLKTYLKNGGILTSQFYFSRYSFELYSDFTFFLEDPVNGDQIRQKENRNLYGLSSIYEKPMKLLGMNSSAYAGIQFRYDDITDLELSRTKDRSTTTGRLKLGNADEAALGAFWSQKFRVGRLDITPALRYDYFHSRYADRLEGSDKETGAGILSPKLDISWQLGDRAKLYSYWGKGFHSNDARVAVLQGESRVLPAAYGTDLGGLFKIGNRMVLQGALWYLWLKQEFVYVGDEAVVEEGGKTKRMGADLSVRYEPFKNFFADVNLNYAFARAVGEPKGQDYIPLAPKLVSTGGVTYRPEYGLNGSLRYRYMGDRPANEDNSVVAKGYMVWDAVLNYTRKRWETGVSIQNLFDVKWKETQFNTESRLYNEHEPVTEIHFTAGTPFALRAHVTVFF